MSIEFKEWGAALLHILYRQIGRYAGARPSIALVWLALSPIPCSAQAMPDQIAYELSTRYTPYADGAAVLDLEQIAPKSINAFDRPLASLHLALDPGHVGGIWAEWEWRNFRISKEDYWIREGELVLEVAQRIRTRLTNLGAEVTLLREDYQPINPMNFIVNITFFLKKAYFSNEVNNSLIQELFSSKSFSCIFNSYKSCLSFFTNSL